MKRYIKFVIYPAYAANIVLFFFHFLELVMEIPIFTSEKDQNYNNQHLTPLQKCLWPSTIVKRTVASTVCCVCVCLSFVVIRNQKNSLSREQIKFGISDATSLEVLHRFNKLRCVLLVEFIDVLMQLTLGIIAYINQAKYFSQNSIT